MNLNDFSKWLQYNKEWKIEGGLNTFRTHCMLNIAKRKFAKHGNFPHLLPLMSLLWLYLDPNVFQNIYFLFHRRKKGQEGK